MKPHATPETGNGYPAPHSTHNFTAATAPSPSPKWTKKASSSENTSRSSKTLTRNNLRALESASCRPKESRCENPRRWKRIREGCIRTYVWFWGGERCVWMDEKAYQVGLYGNDQRLLTVVEGVFDDEREGPTEGRVWGCDGRDVEEGKRWSEEGMRMMGIGEDENGAKEKGGEQKWKWVKRKKGRARTRISHLKKAKNKTPGLSETRIILLRKQATG